MTPQTTTCPYCTTRTPREGAQPAAAFSRSKRGLSEPFDPANYVFKAFPKDCPFQPKDAVQIADEETGEVFVGRVVDKAAMVGNVLRVGVLFEDSPNMRMVPADALTARLTADEQTTLEQHEQVIGRGIKVFFEVGEALLAIRDSRLYRATHATFEAYCQERWDFNRNRANQLIGAAQVIANLTTNGGQTLPLNERQTRPLTSLPPAIQPLALEVAQKTSNGNMTGTHMQSVVNVVKDIIKTAAIDDGTGNDIPIEQATDAHVIAAITEETYERMKRQQQHIQEAAERKQAALVAKAKVNELVLQVVPRDEMGYVRIADQHGCIFATMALVYEDAHGNDFNVEEGTDYDLAKALVNAFNGRKQA